MKRITAMMVMWAMLYNVVFAGFSFADDNYDIYNRGDNDNRNYNYNAADANAEANASSNQSQSEWQKQMQRMVSNITTPGNLIAAGTHQISQTQNQTGDYGRIITTSSLSSTAQFFCGMSELEFGVMVETINKEATESWEDVNDKIISHPFIRKKFPALDDKDKVYFPKGEMAFQVLRTSVNSQIVGGWFYDSKFKKNNSVLKAHLQMRARMDAAKLGANVVIAVDEFDQRYFVPESFEFSLSGVVSWISKCFTSGGSVAGSAGMVSGQNSAFARPGAGFIFLRIEGVTDVICQEAPPVVIAIKKVEPDPPVVIVEPPVCNPSKIWIMIKRAERAIVACTTWCYDNLVNRRDAYVANIDMYACTHDKKYLEYTYYEGRIKHDGAMRHFEKAEQNYKLGGRSIEMHQAKADAIMKKAYLEWAICIKITRGKRAVREFIKAKNLDINPDHVPSDFIHIP